jgi:NADH-quinone oxidoreductase subunit L
MESLLYTALFAPLTGSVFAGVLGSRKKMLIAGVVPSILLFVSLIASLGALTVVISTGNPIQAQLFDWIMMGNFDTKFGFQIDQVTAVMICVVTTVSAMVHVYSIGYMSHDESFNRFFSYLSLFVFSMMILVMSDNFLGLFVGWEGVGVCSYLLIGFWYYKRSASWAANEAFIMNRIADLGMLLGIALLYWQLGSVKYDYVFANVASIDSTTLYWIAALLFVGAMGKSAQFPMHTWLADAMEGPTPVSALIHAATMVTAGVYLVVRANALYAEVPEVGLFIASLGTFVAFFAASMALVNRDMKRIIAYSTLSQLGYMFAAAGLGAYWVALFHLMTHAFFKALLFLGAGNVMHAMDDELDPFKMGGLKKTMKWTFIMMTLASVALAGIWPLAGFYSKDTILEVAFVDHHPVIYAVLLITALLTAFYSFRLLALIFHGEERYKKFGFHPHEAYNYVLIAMSPLAILAVIAGFMFKGGYYEMVTTLLPATEYHIHNHTTFYIMLFGTQIAVGLAIAYAYYKYTKTNWQDSGAEKSFIYQLLFNQYYIPKFYNETFIKTYIFMSKVMWKFVDQKIVDASVDLIARTVYKTGEKGARLHNGNLSTMLRLMSLGFIMLLVIALSLKMFTY